MKKTPKLTPKQEAFALTYVEAGNASEAYRRAYDVGEDTKPERIWSDACKLLANPKVAQRVAELQMQAQERAQVTIDDVVQALKNEAGIGDKPSDTTSPARVSALDKIMKHLGGYGRDNDQKGIVINLSGRESDY